MPVGALTAVVVIALIVVISFVECGPAAPAGAARRRAGAERAQGRRSRPLNLVQKVITPERGQLDQR